MVHRLSWMAVGLACLIVGAATVYADEPAADEKAADETPAKPAREVWTFEKAGVERAVDVTDLPDFVREAVAKRLEGEGFRRRSPAQARRRGRDLAADARELARHGGRFPATPRLAGETPFPRRVEESRPAPLDGRVETCLELLDRLPPQDPQAAAARALLRRWICLLELRAGRRGRVLGAEVVTDSGPGWRVDLVPSGTLAAALGLVPGDRIITADDAPATPDTLVTWRDPIPSRTQRTLGLLRRNGRRATWTLQWNDRLSPDPAPATRR